MTRHEHHLKQHISYRYSRRRITKTRRNAGTNSYSPSGCHQPAGAAVRTNRHHHGSFGEDAYPTQWQRRNHPTINARRKIAITLPNKPTYDDPTPRRQIKSIFPGPIHFDGSRDSFRRLLEMKSKLDTDSRVLCSHTAQFH